MKIGYACTPLIIPYKTTRKFILKSFSEENFLSTTKNNILDLNNILKFNNENNIKLFRISSDIIPFGSHDVLNIPWISIFKDELKKIGNYIKENNLRVSMHPGQYTVLNSPKEDIVLKAIKDLEYHNEFLNSLQIDYTHKIILHVGGVYDDKLLSSKRFVENFNRLSDSLKKRLIIENDEKNYSLYDVLDIADKCCIPVIYDNLHQECYKKEVPNSLKILEDIKQTWKSQDGDIKVHYSNQAPNKKIGSHSSYIYCEDFLNYIENTSSLDFDMMLEVKDKDISAIKALNLLKEKNGLLTEGDKKLILNNYSYILNSYSEHKYKEGEDLIFSHSLKKFYLFVEDSMSSPAKEEFYKQSLKSISLSLEENLTQKEVSHFHKLLKENKLSKCRDYLHKCERNHSSSPIYNFFYYYDLL